MLLGPATPCTASRLPAVLEAVLGGGRDLCLWARARGPLYLGLPLWEDELPTEALLSLR